MRKLNFTPIFRNKILTPLILCIFSVLIAVILNIYFYEEIKVKNVFSDFQNEIYQQQEILNSDLQFFSNEIASEENFPNLDLCSQEKNYYENGVLFLIYENDSLKYWSDNSVPVPDIYSDDLFGAEFNSFENGWFLIKQIQKENKRIIGLQLLKNDYKYQNEYLKNDFQDNFSLNSNIQINRTEGDYKIYSVNGDYLFSLQMNVAARISDKRIYILLLLYLLGLLFFISFLFQAHKYVTRNFKKSWIFIVTFIVDIIILRLIFVYLKIPNILFESDFFSPIYYASSNFLPSLGNLLIDAILLFIISYVINTHLNLSKSIIRLKLVAKQLAIIVIFILVFLLFEGLLYLFRSIIINSSIIQFLLYTYKHKYICSLNASLRILQYHHSPYH